MHLQDKAFLCQVCQYPYIETHKNTGNKSYRILCGNTIRGQVTLDIFSIDLYSICSNQNFLKPGSLGKITNRAFFDTFRTGHLNRLNAPIPGVLTT